MTAATRVTASAARPACRPTDIPFETSADAAPLNGLVIGQERAERALRFGVGIRRHGYNVFAVGRPGLGKQTFLRTYLDQQAKTDKAPSDWCYVHDFVNPEHPRALALPAGMGVRLQRDVAAAIAELHGVMRSTFESEEYRTRRRRIFDQFTAPQEAAVAAVRDRAAKRDVAVLNSANGIVIAPIHGGKTLDPEGFRALPDSEQDKLRAEVERVGHELEELFQSARESGREQREQLKALDRETAASAARRVFETVRSHFAEHPSVLAYLSELELDAVDNADEFLSDAEEGFEATFRRALSGERGDGPAMRRYQVNLLVRHDETHGAPIVYEDHPTYANLIGRIEHEAQFGALITNFTLIKAGAFHRASGGYLLIDALKLLQQPLAWEAVKRTLRSGEIRIEPLSEALGLVSTLSLRPAPVPLGDTKVVLMGERVLYYLLAALDPDFLELFKVLVDFEENMDRRPDTQAVYANLLATLISSKGLRPFDRSGVASVIDHSARAANDGQKLSLHMRQIVDLLQEADYWAGQRQHEVADATDVQAAIDAQLERAGSVPERLKEAVERGDIQIASSGESTGQVNALSVFQLGERVFGHPTRITARVRMGKGEVIDIEREVKLGGPVHSKGVLILSGFLGARYATGVPFSLSATLVFEQSYGAIEGDSASLAELCALLSAIADAPICQSFAVTGSVDQHGQVQAIGAVNEKIEGFFELCQARGLTGAQGVLIPRSNLKNLMVHKQVADAIDAGTFHLYAVDSVDEAIELLTGKPAGARDDDGHFPKDSLNGLVEARLLALAEHAHAFGSKSCANADVRTSAVVRSD